MYQGQTAVEICLSTIDWGPLRSLCNTETQAENWEGAYERKGENLCW